MNDGYYSVVVTDQVGCAGYAEKSINSYYFIELIGEGTTCNNGTYSIKGSPSDASYKWSVPVGATFTQNGNIIIVEWKKAYPLGGTIGNSIPSFSILFARRADGCATRKAKRGLLGFDFRVAHDLAPFLEIAADEAGKFRGS